MFDVFKSDAVKFLQSHSTAVIATVDEQARPNTSVIYYVVGHNNVIRFITKSETQKHANLTKNPYAAMTILDEHKPITLSIEGVAKDISDTPQYHEVLEAITKIGNENHGSYAPIIKLHKGSFRVYELRPTRGLLTDYSSDTVGEQQHKF